MKTKLILNYLLILLTTTTYSQESSERYIFGGSLGFNYSSSKSNNTSINPDSKSINLTSSIMAGYFINNNIGLGIAIEYYIKNTNYKDNSIEYSKESNSLFSPFLRYYLKSNLFFHSQVNIGYANSEAKINIFPPTPTIMITSSNFIYGYGVGIGYDIKLHDRIYLEPLLKFISNRLDNKEKENYLINNYIYFNLGVVIRL
jgi:hypothetical protein